MKGFRIIRKGFGIIRFPSHDDYVRAVDRLSELGAEPYKDFFSECSNIMAVKTEYISELRKNFRFERIPQSKITT